MITETRREWVPKTKLGRSVKNGEITSMEQIYEKNMAVLEPEIADALVPGLQEEVLDLRMVQRTTDSGRKGSFMITVGVGNKDGYLGIGTGKGLEIGPTVERAVRAAKKGLIHIRRGCGSWECGCGMTHSLPFKVYGRNSSVKVRLSPAPKGTGIVACETTRKLLELAGVHDIWSETAGDTRTTFNTVRATFEALRQTRKMRTMKEVDVA
jgi:small subunit ribosomal protein S5